MAALALAQEDARPSSRLIGRFLTNIENLEGSFARLRVIWGDQ
jgi:hypothetical protein